MGIQDKMELALRTDLIDIDWEVMTDLYQKAYHRFIAPDRMKNIFGRSYLTRIAILENQIVGAGYALSDGELDATIHGIAVLPEFQRRGIGGRIMRSIIEGLPANVAKIWTCEPRYENFYRQMGFKKLKTAMAIGFPEDQME